MTGKPKTQKTPKTHATPVLQYERGRFILEEPRNRTPELSYWKATRMINTWETRDLGAAAKYRRYADEKTEKILTRTFQQHYPVSDETAAALRKLPIDPHQYAGIMWALSRKRSYLAHAPGAGKTCEAIMVALWGAKKAHGHSVFIVPPSLVGNWEREILRFTKWRRGVYPCIGVVGATSEKDHVAWRADYIIVPDSMLAKPWVQEKLQEMTMNTLVVDEASRLKEYDSERSLAFYGGAVDGKSYPGIFKDARHVVFLDGSPMPNRPIELWAPTYALHPEAIDCLSRDDFGYRYCGARPNEFGKWEYLYSSNEEELRGKLQEDFMHVVTEDELSHPERLRSMLVMTKDVRSLEHREWEQRNLSGITFDGENASQGDLARFRHELGMRKVPWVAQYVRERLRDKNESILLFAWHRDVVAALACELRKYPFGIINGGVDAKKREEHVKNFQSGKYRLLILNIAAGGRGYNLQRADRAVFAEWSWTDETNRQCEKRGSRKGSTKRNLRCDYIVCPGSLDEPVLRSCFTKERRVRKVIG